MAVCVGYILLW